MHTVSQLKLKSLFLVKRRPKIITKLSADNKNKIELQITVVTCIPAQEWHMKNLQALVPTYFETDQTKEVLTDPHPSDQHYFAHRNN